MDIAALTAFLAPLLPRLLQLGERVGDAITQRAGDEVFGFASRIWARLRGKVEEKEAAREAVADVARDPEDEDLVTVLRVQLKKLLTEDEELAAEVARIWAEASASGATGTTVTASGAGSVAIGRDVSGSTISTSVSRPAE
jgi:hypothetical protein